MAAKKKVKAAAPKTCVKKHTLTRENRCQDIKKFFNPKGRFVTNNKTYAAAAQSTLPQPAPKPTPMIDLVSESSSESCITVDTAKGPASVIAKTTSPAAKPCDADAPLAATTSDADARVASTSQGPANAKTTYASIAAKPCDASAPLDSSSPALNPGEDPSNEPQKNGTASTSSSSTAPSPPPSKRRPDDEDAPPQKRRRENSSSSSTLAPSPASSSPAPSRIADISSTSTPSSPKRRRVNSSITNIATTSVSSSTPSSIGTATSSTPTPSSSTSPPSSNGLTINTTLYEKLAEGFKMVEIDGDGACFFRACSHQEYGTEERHQEFRDAAQQYFVANRDEMEHQILALHGGTYQQFLDEQSKQETFADYFDVSAVANVYGIRIIVYRPDTRASVFDPVNGVTDPSKKPYLLAFVNNNHYNSIIPVDQECNTDENLLNGAATSLKRSDESIAMDYVTPRRTLPARRSKFVKAPVIDNDSDDGSVFEDDPMQSDDDYEMESDDSVQRDGDYDMEESDASMHSDGTSVEEDESTEDDSEYDIEQIETSDMELSNDPSSSTTSQYVKNEDSSNMSSLPSPSTTGAAKKDQSKLTREEKLLLQLNEEFVKLHHRRDYFAKNNEQPLFPYSLEYKVLAMSFFHSKKGGWWTSFEIAKWIEKKFLYYKNLKNKRWLDSLRNCLINSCSLFVKRGARTDAKYSFIGKFPDVDKANTPRMSQLIVSPKKSNRKTQLAYEKYAKDFIHYHLYQKYYSTNDVSPTARIGGLVMYFFFCYQEKGDSWNLRDIIKWVKENVMFYRNKPNENWHNQFQSFLKRNNNVFPKNGSQLKATYSFRGNFPQVQKVDLNRDSQHLQPIQTSNQKKSNNTYIHGIKLMKCTPKLAVEKDEDFIYFHQYRDYFATNNVKPELHYGVFVRYLFSQNPVGTWFTLKEIYTWIEENVLYYKNQPQTWRNSLRTYLSTNADDFPYRGSGYSAQYSHVRTFPEVDPDVNQKEPEFPRKKLFTKFADEQIIQNWTFTDESKKEIKIPSCSHTYHILDGTSRTPDNIKYLYCVNCSSKNHKLGQILGYLKLNLKSKTNRLQLNNGVLRGNYKDNHLCEDEEYADVSGRKQFGMFTADDSERYIESLEELANYMAQLQGETLKLIILQYVPDPWLQTHFFRCVYLYGLSSSSDLRSFLYIGVSMNPWVRLTQHSGKERPEMFKNADGSKREIYMIIILCMPSFYQLAYELEAALISYGQKHHRVLKLKKPLTNVDKGRWQNPRFRLRKISRSTRNADFGKVGRALCALLDDGVARGPRISSLAVGVSGEEKEEKKEYRRLQSS